MIVQKTIRMKKIYSLLAVLVCFFGYSQNYKGEISDVKQSGLNQITIDPTVRAFAKNDLRYLRILDSKQNQIPYAFVNQKTQSDSYSPFKIVSKTTIPDSISSLVIQNEMRNRIRNFSLQIQNTSLTKSYSVSGSNDGNQWFGLVQDQMLTDLESVNSTSVSKIISFPTNTYGYLRIVINDKKSLPINVLAVGIAETQLIPEKLVEIKDFSYKILEDQKLKMTKIVFSASNNFDIDAIAFDISTDYYNRSASITAKRERRTKKRTNSYEEEVVSFNLNSKKDRTIYFSTINENEFTIEIENQDNQPLNIKGIQVLQKPLVIVSKLNKDEKYSLVIDTTYSKPSYDLESFVAGTVVNLPEVTIMNFTKLNKQNTLQAEKSFWQTKLFMWLCIIFGGGIVAYFAFGLLKDMKE